MRGIGWELTVVDDEGLCAAFLPAADAALSVSAAIADRSAICPFWSSCQSARIATQLMVDKGRIRFIDDEPAIKAMAKLCA